MNRKDVPSKQGIKNKAWTRLSFLMILLVVAGLATLTALGGNEKTVFAAGQVGIVLSIVGVTMAFASLGGVIMVTGWRKKLIPALSFVLSVLLALAAWSSYWFSLFADSH